MHFQKGLEFTVPGGNRLSIIWLPGNLPSGVPRQVCNGEVSKREEGIDKGFRGQLMSECELRL